MCTISPTMLDSQFLKQQTYSQLGVLMGRILREARGTKEQFWAVAAEADTRSNLGAWRVHADVPNSVWIAQRFLTKSNMAEQKFRLNTWLRGRTCATCFG